jgi:hypothetical protein
MICLRVLGRGSVIDDVAEMSNSFESTCHAIFKKFVNNVCGHFFKLYVKPPTGERLLFDVELT